MNVIIDSIGDKGSFDRTVGLGTDSRRMDLPPGQAFRQSLMQRSRSPWCAAACPRLAGFPGFSLWSAALYFSLRPGGIARHPTTDWLPTKTRRGRPGVGVAVCVWATVVAFPIV